MAGYAVIDLETTGLNPSTDRVVEVGVVLLDHAGERVEEMVTLIDPRRDIGVTGIHGIRAADVVGAPAFEDVAGHLLDLLAGRVLVAHNAWFDLRFLAQELRRCGLSLGQRPYVCTMHLGAQLFGARSLSACCDVLGVANSQAHSALGDARATADILRLTLQDCERAGLPGVGHVNCSDSETTFDTRPAHLDSWRAMFAGLVDGVTAGHGWDYTAHSRDEALQQRADGANYLAELVGQLPAVGATPQLHNYLALLDEALEDRLLTRTEAAQLAAAAQELGCSAAQVAHAHRLYLDALVGVALADGVVTPAEEQDLLEVAQLIGLSHEDLTAAISLAGSGATVILPTNERLTLPQGAVIVFTGAMSMERDDLENLARQIGLTPARNVTKKTALVVAADAQSQSGKARAARDKGIRIISESVFHQLVAERPARVVDLTEKVPL